MANSKTIIIALILILALSIQAKKNSAFTFYPYGAYSEETSTFLGAYANYTWHSEAFPENQVPPSIDTNIIISFKKQLRLLIRNKFVILDGRYAVGIPFRYYYWPTEYYGLQNQSKPDISENYTRRYYEFFPYLEKPLNQKYILTSSLYLEKSEISDSDANNPLLNDEVTGFEDYQLSGAELKLERNTIDKPYFPTKGMNMAFTARVYHKNFGSDFSFNTFMVDLRKYAVFSKLHTFAGQLLYKSVSGDQPFEKLIDLGSSMRGYGDHVYVNNKLLACRLEDRVFPFNKKFWNRIGFAVFTETGQSFDTFDKLAFHNQKISAGIGLRYILQRLDMLTLRIDFAISNDGLEMEITSFEAF